MEFGKDHVDKFSKTPDECGSGTSDLSSLPLSTGMIDFKTDHLPDIYTASSNINENSFSILDLKSDFEIRQGTDRANEQANKDKDDLRSSDSSLELIFAADETLESLEKFSCNDEWSKDDREFDLEKMEHITECFLKQMKNFKIASNENITKISLLNKIEKLKELLKESKEKNAKLEMEMNERELNQRTEIEQLKIQQKLTARHRDQLLKDCCTLRKDSIYDAQKIKSLEEKNMNLHKKIDTLLRLNDEKNEKYQWISHKNFLGNDLNKTSRDDYMLQVYPSRMKQNMDRLTMFNDFNSYKNRKMKSNPYIHFEVGTDDDDDVLEIDSAKRVSKHFKDPIDVNFLK